MERRVSTRLTAEAGRRFGVTVGSAFLALAGLGWWRGGGNATIALASLGAALTIAGLVLPTRLGPIEWAWMWLAERLSRVTNPIVMGALYLLVVTPVGVLRRALGGSSLEHQLVDGTYWKARPAGLRQSASLERQF